MTFFGFSRRQSSKNVSNSIALSITTRSHAYTLHKWRCWQPYAAAAAGDKLILAPGFAARKNKVTELARGLERIGKCWFFETELGVAKLKIQSGSRGLDLLDCD